MSIFIILMFAFMLISIIRAYSYDIRYGQEKLNNHINTFSAKIAKSTYLKR